MPDDIGHFKVVLEAEVDRNVGKSLEEGFEKSSEKIGKNLQKEIEESIDKSVEKARKFEKSFKIPSFGQIGEKLTGFLGESTKKITAGGIASAAGENSGSGIMAIVGKLGIVVGILALVYDVIKSLAPVVAIFKLISAMLQLTLYPIAQFLLTIFKPVLGILLKYLILPFFYVWGPKIVQMADGILKFFGVGDKNEKNPIDSIIDKIKLLLSLLFGIPTSMEDMIVRFELLKNILTGVWNVIDTYILNPLRDVYNWITSTWWVFLYDYLVKPLANFIEWDLTIWKGIFNFLTKPLIDFINWLSSTWIGKLLNIQPGSGSGSGGGGGGGGTVGPNALKIEGSSEGGRWNAWLNGKYVTRNSMWDMLVKILNQKGVPNSAITNASANLGQIITFAKGGIVNSPTVGLLGERGPEAVIPLSKLNTNPINITFNIAKIEKSVDIDQITSQIERTLYTNMKRAGAR